MHFREGSVRLNQFEAVGPKPQCNWMIFVQIKAQKRKTNYEQVKVGHIKTITPQKPN